MTEWLLRPSSAFGDETDVAACARVFADVQEAMVRARPLATTFTNAGEDIWSGSTADSLREKMREVPEYLRRFAEANHEVSSALYGFGPALGDYQRDRRTLQSQGRGTQEEIDRWINRRETTIEQLKARDGGLGEVTALLTAYRNDPQVLSCTTHIERLQAELDRLERHFYSNEDEFASAVRMAIDLISNSDDVLYNNTWDKFWSQTVEPVLEVVRVVLEIAMVVLMIAAMIGSGGTLAPLIVAGLLVAVSATEIIGTAAAGHEVTAEMWLDLAINIAAFATLGAARSLKGAKMAVKANKLQARKALHAGRKMMYAEKVAKGKQLQASVKFAHKMERGAERVEGGLDLADGADKASKGDFAGAGVSIGKGIIDIGGARHVVAEGARAVHAGIGAGEGVSELAGHGEPHSPKTWPGLQGPGEPS